MKAYQDIEIELKEEEIEKLNKMAKKYNMTLNELINHILKEQLAKRIHISNIKYLTEEEIKNNYFLVHNDKEVFGIIEPYSV